MKPTITIEAVAAALASNDAFAIRKLLPWVAAIEADEFGEGPCQGVYDADDNFYAADPELLLNLSRPLAG